MDVLYHGLVGAVIAERTSAPSPLPAILSALLPDVVGTVPFYAFKLLRALQRPGPMNLRNLYADCMSNTFTNRIDKTAYRFTHSFVTALLYSLILFTWFRDIWLPASLGYISHILIDIPTHDGEFAARIFYPYFRVKIAGVNWTSNPALFLLFWGVLGAGYWLAIS